MSNERTTTELTAVAERLLAWMHEQSWPLWWRAARLDNGAFREVLDFDGRAVADDTSRVRVQARQIFSFALAQRLGWNEPGLQAGLASSLERFLATCFGSDGVAGRRVDIQSGELRDETPDLYDNAFCVLALAACRQVLAPARVDEAVGRLLTSIDGTLGRDDGEGYHEFLPPPTARRQNPHMHLFESLLLLYDATRDEAVAHRAATLFAFIEERFFDRRQAVVSEEVESPGASVADYEPGHSMEWVWLLGYRARLTGLPLHAFAPRLYEHYIGAGVAEGLTPMGLTTANQPVDATRRLWSQTESLKAHLCMLELGPDALRADAGRRALECAVAIEDEWLTGTCPGGWRDHFDAEGVCIARDMPASTGYHLYLAIAELSRIASTAGAR